MNTCKLPMFDSPSLEWRSRGSCRDVDPLVFYGPDYERSAARQRRVAKAKSICLKCPVKRICLAQSFKFPEQHGVWGGLTAAERKHLLQQIAEVEQTSAPPDIERPAFRRGPR